VALPNMRAGECVVPEIRGVIKAEMVVTEAFDLLHNPQKRQSMSQKLKSIMGEKGAASQLVKTITHFRL
jgi:lipid A disaccharide synthetase